MDPSKSYYLGTRGASTTPTGSEQARELDVRVRAHQVWDEENNLHEQDWKHWFQAEQEFHEMVGGW